jgi:CRISPR/Cas system-associated endonuclease Cas3-HD
MFFRYNEYAVVSNMYVNKEIVEVKLKNTIETKNPKVTKAKRIKIQLFSEINPDTSGRFFF